MNTSPPNEVPVPRLQQLMENIWFLLFIGFMAPTISYTTWSVIDLAHLPNFGDEPAHAAHAIAGTSATAGTANTSAATSPEGVQVAMKSMAYHPGTLEIAAGETVTWRNDDMIPHAVASGTPDTPDAERAFTGSGDFAPGESFSMTFEEPGTHPVYCSTPGHYAAGMTMTIVVKEASP